jgi:eukaryotic-like serine/threonine-protein kinase
MNKRWREIERIFHAARELSASARAEFLAKACAEDPALRERVEFLLAQAEQAGSFLETPAVEVAAEALAKEKKLSDPLKPAVEPGAMIAHYRLAEKIGEGGMGEVYRARDTKLGRDVALKILPQALAHDRQRMARFEREAQVLASLNHPNIAAIYGLEESNGIRALAMELVEGETLGERLRRPRPLTRPASHDNPSPPAGRGEKFNNLTPSPSGRGWPAGPGEGPSLAIDDALPIARQIAEALEYAHERGVIHRDLKPANVKITPEGTVKVLDFGLAKMLNPQDSSAALDPADSPTLSMTATEKGMILGTAAYMSPEQAKGQQVDRRCDIWAFGCVLYEMLSGRKPFEGETISDVLASVIKSDPDWTALPETTPQSIQKLIRRCLQKDVRQRLQAIGDARITLEEELSGTGVSPVIEQHGPEGHATRPLRRALPWAVAIILAAALITVVFLWKFAEPTLQPVIRFTVAPPENAYMPYGGQMSLSPDGRRLAFVAQTAPNAPTVLWVRSLDALTARPVQGTDGADWPFWSPDGNYVGFYAAGKLEKVAISGGQPQAMCDARGNGATWSQNGVIVFTDNGRLYRVPETGGTPTLAAAPDPARHGEDYLLPQFLPDDRHFLFLIGSGSPSAGSWFSIGIGSLDSREIERLSHTDSNAFYSPPGYLLYMGGTTLMARPFDAKGLKFTGQAVPIAEGVEMFPLDGYCNFAVSQRGVLAYQIGASAPFGQMVWLNRKGQKLGTVGQPDIYTNPALSPDGTKLAVGRGEPNKRDLWVYDLKRRTASRLTFNPADDLTPVWSHDGSTIMFTSTRRGQRDLYEKPANGLGKTQLVYASKDHAKNLMDWSPDGRYALYDTDSIPDLWTLPLFGDRKPFPSVEGDFGATQARFSPDGRYIAYTSDESGQSEVYVQTFPQHLGKWEVSTSGGTGPMWRRDGNELFYLKLDDTLMSVDVKTSAGEFQAGIPKPLFQAQLITGGWRNRYVISPDGQRFLMIVPASEAARTPITVVVNWPALLKKQ